MGKAAQKKQQKRAALMKSAYDLFTTNGFTSTTIRDISHKAGVAKGTFYLYFNDKVDIRDAVIRSTSSRLLQDACASLDEQIAGSGEPMDVPDMFIYIIDYLIEAVAKDLFLVRFLSKHLSWGLFYDADEAPRDPSEEPEIAPINFASYIKERLDEWGVKIRDLDLLLFTLLELVSSTVYDLVMYKQPQPLEEFKPYLNNCIRLLVSSAIIE